MPTRWRQNVVKIFKCVFLEIVELEFFQNVVIGVKKCDKTDLANKFATFFYTDEQILKKFKLCNFKQKQILIF